MKGETPQSSEIYLSGNAETLEVRPGGAPLARATTDTVCLLLASVTSGLAVLTQTFLFVRFSTPEIYGKYQYIASVTGVAALFSLPGMNSAVSRASARGFDRTLWAATKVRFRFSWAGTLALVLTAALLTTQGQNDVAVGIAVAAFLFPFLFALDSYLSYLTGKRHFRRFAAFTAVLKLVPLPLLLVILLMGNRLEYVVLVSFLTTALLHMMLLFTTVRALDENQEVETEAIRYGRRLSGLNLIGTIQSYLSSLITGIFLGVVQLALFTVGKVVADLFKQAMYLLNLQLFPVLAIAAPHDGRRLAKRSLAIGFPLTLFTGIAAVVALHFGGPRLLQGDYNESVRYAQILVAGMVLSFPGNQCRNYFASQGLLPAQVKLGLGALGLEIAFLLILVKPLGLTGVVLARALVGVFDSIFGLILFRRSGPAGEPLASTPLDS